MKSSVLLALVSAMCLALLSMPANAQATRTWISGVGDDANPCSRTAPCKTFAGAISKTSAAGEINCLDPGGFGAVTITKSISLVCDPVSNGGVLVAGTNGVTVNDSGAASIIVVLQGLDFEGVNSGTNGVSVLSAKSVQVINCRIRNFTTAGVSVTPSANGVSVDVIDTIIDNSVEGIFVKPTGSGTVRGSINRTRTVNNSGDGVFLNANATSGSIKMDVRDSLSANNGANGYAVASAGSVAQLQIDSSTASDNATGLGASGNANAILRFTRSTVFANTTGANATAPAQVLSYQTNSVDGNGSPGTFTTTGQQ
jgi:hypothetical protein